MNKLSILIDGYNLLHQSPWMERGNGPEWLYQQRRKLVVGLATLLSEFQRASTLVVFDAHTGKSANTMDFVYEAIQVQYAHQHKSADDYIEDLIYAHPAPRTLTVVTSDRRIQHAAKSCRAAFIDSRTWLDRLIVQAQQGPEVSKTKDIASPPLLKRTTRILR
jgi:uncharacterized protein